VADAGLSLGGSRVVFLLPPSIHIFLLKFIGGSMKLSALGGAQSLPKPTAGSICPWRGKIYGEDKFGHLLGRPGNSN
jgi:hypothetical protein